MSQDANELRRKSRARKRHLPSASSKRDWFDWSTLLTAAVGTVVVVTSTVLTQLGSTETGKRAAESLRVLTQQARASEIQAKAATKMASITSQQLDGLRTQLGEMKSQSTALAASAGAANSQLRQATQHNRLTVRPIVGFLREGAMGGEVGIYIYNNGSGPAMVRDLQVYVDNQKLKDISELEHVELALFRSETAHWNSFRNQRTITPSTRIALYYTDSDNIVDIDAFRDLIQNRITVIAKACSLYEECEFVCSKPNPGAHVGALPYEFRKC